MSANEDLENNLASAAIERRLEEYAKEKELERQEALERILMEHFMLDEHGAPIVEGDNGSRRTLRNCKLPAQVADALEAFAKREGTSRNWALTSILIDFFTEERSRGKPNIESPRSNGDMVGKKAWERSIVAETREDSFVLVKLRLECDGGMSPSKLVELKAIAERAWTEICEAEGMEYDPFAPERTMSTLDAQDAIGAKH